MALEPGGYADKLGNRYEGRWVVRQLLRVLDEKLRSVTCEALGDDERGVDLWVERPDGVRQDQQCKIRNRSSDSWSIGDLQGRGILGAMKGHLDRGPANQFALVTPLPSILVHDICQSARNSSGNPEEFFFHQIEAISEDRRKGFRQFCQRLSLDTASQDDRAKAFSYLQRLFIEHWPDTGSSREDLIGHAGMLVCVPPTDNHRRSWPCLPTSPKTTFGSGSTPQPFGNIWNREDFIHAGCRMMRTLYQPFRSSKCSLPSRSAVT